jgi:hypothetical protein
MENTDAILDTPHRNLPQQLESTLGLTSQVMLPKSSSLPADEGNSLLELLGFPQDQFFQDTNRTATATSKPRRRVQFVAGRYSS